MGRGHEADLRLGDISVSRSHAALKLKNLGFQLKDKKSKFGTLVLVRKKLWLDPLVTRAV